MTNAYVMVLRSGGIYHPGWVRRLADMLAEHRTDERVICLSDTVFFHPGVEVLPAPTRWPGWWAKLGVFIDHALPRIDGSYLYLDLDTTVLGNPASLFRKSNGFSMCKDFLHWDKGWHNSSVMSWRGDLSFIPDSFVLMPDVRMAQYKRTREGRIGDQAYIEDACKKRIQIDTFPDGAVVSARFAVPPGALLIQHHGNTKPKVMEN